MENAEVLMLDPDLILADDNSRFGLKRLRIESLMQSILDQGGVMQPVEVEPIEPVNGKEYRLTAGFYRHAAVTELNTKQNAGILLPVIQHETTDDTERLKRQLAENMERENQSPMDKATAIRKLVDAGISKVDIRKIFSTPGGRKGLTLQPASNSFINMTLSFLELPKAIQEKIHNGTVGVAAAYELTKVSPDKRAVVLERAEADRIKAIESEEKDEAKFLDSERKAAEAREKAEQVTKDLEAAKVLAASLEADVKAKQEAAAAAYKAAKAAKGEDKEKADEAFKAAEAEAKAVEKASERAESDIAKLGEKSEKVAKTAAELAERLSNARKAVKTNAGNKGKTAVGQGDVKKAAADSGNATGPVKLTASQMREALLDHSRPGAFPKVREMLLAVIECFDGVTTPGQMYAKLGTMTGEKKAKAPKAAA